MINTIIKFFVTINSIDDECEKQIPFWKHCFHIFNDINIIFIEQLL